MTLALAVDISLTLLVLALLEQLQLPAQHQDFLLLGSQRFIERPQGIFLVGQLGLHLNQQCVDLACVRQK